MDKSVNLGQLRTLVKQAQATPFFALLRGVWGVNLFTSSTTHILDVGFHTCVCVFTHTHTHTRLKHISVWNK